MENQPAPFHMAQEVMAQAHSVAGPFNEAGNVGHNVAGTGILFHHTQHRGEGGKVVVGDFGLGGTDHADKGRFAHIGESHQSHVSQQLQFQGDIAPFPGGARLGKTRDLPGGSGKMLIASASFAALEHQHRFRAGHVGQQPSRFRFPHQGTPGKRE